MESKSGDLNKKENDKHASTSKSRKSSSSLPTGIVFQYKDKRKFSEIVKSPSKIINSDFKPVHRGKNDDIFIHMFVCLSVS